MSHDQRPGKIRVIANAAPVTSEAPQPATVDASTPARSKGLSFSILAFAVFLLACGAGGALTSTVLLF